MSPAGILPAIGGGTRRSRRLRLLASLVASIAATAAAQPNLLVNYAFDTDLAGWTRVENRPAEWGGEDLFGRPLSGSALLTHEEASANANLSILRQCVPITAQGGYRISGWIYNPPGQDVPGNASIAVQPSRELDCSGTLGTLSRTASASSANWQYREWDFEASHPSVPWRAILVTLSVSKAQAVTTPRRARFDHVALRHLDDASPLPRIFVVRSGNGVGRVDSAPSGIDCGSTCFAAFEPGTVLTLTAAAQSGYAFARWTGGPCRDSADPVCRFIVEQQDTAGAEFTTRNTLSVLFDGNGSGRIASVPAGVDCTGPSCLVPFPTGTSVTLTATADAGSRFAGWQTVPFPGDCTGPAVTCTVVMTVDRIARPLFELIAPTEHPLTVTVHGTGGGLVESTPGSIHCPSICSDDFIEGTSVGLTAMPAGGSAFDHWEGGCSGTAPTCVLTMDAPRVARAHFRTVPPPSLEVLLAGDGSGRVTGSPGGIDCPGICGGAYAAGTVVTLLASALPGSIFDHWEGACEGGVAECVLAMSGDRTVLAVFRAAAQTHPLDVAILGEGSGRIVSEPAGIDCPGACSASFAAGSELVLFASAAAGSAFAGWQDVICSAAGTAPCALRLDGAVSVGGRFDLDSETVFSDGFDLPPPAAVPEPPL